MQKVIRCTQLLELHAMCIAPADDDINLNGGQGEVQERTDGLFSLMRDITAAIEYKDTAEMPIPSAQFLLCLIKLLTQECMRGTKEEFAEWRYKPVVAMLHCAIEILTEQYIAVMPPIGKVVDHKDLTDERAHDPFPHLIECIAVDDEAHDRCKCT